MLATGSQGSLGWRARNSGLPYVLHIRRAGPEVKGLTYQARDSLFIYSNYPHLIHKATASGYCDSYTMETRGMERPMHHHHTHSPECHTGRVLPSMLVGHPDNLLTNDPETFPLLQPGHSPRPSTYCCVGTDGSLWGRCLTTGRYLDYSQGWRHLSLVRAGPPNQKVEPPASPGPVCPLRPPQLPSGSHQLCLWPRVCGVRGSRKNSRRGRQLPTGLAWPQQGGQFDEDAAWASSSHQMVLRRLPGPPPPCSGFYLWVASGQLAHPETQPFEHTCAFVGRRRDQVSSLSALPSPCLSRVGDDATTSQKIRQRSLRP